MQTQQMEDRITFRMKADAYTQIENLARKHGLTVASMARFIILDWLTTPERKKDLLDIL